MLQIKFNSPLSLRLIYSIFVFISFFSLSLNSFATSVGSSELSKPLTSDRFLGDEAAPVTIIEYASFTCGHCATFHNLVLDKVKSKYIDTGKVKFIFREVFFDKFGLAGALIGRCENDSDFYFKFADKLFKEQREWMASKNEAELLSHFQNLAEETGLDKSKFVSCLNNNENADILLNWYHNNAEADDIRSTPAFLINGKKYSNMSFTAMSEIIEAELEE